MKTIPLSLRLSLSKTLLTLLCSAAGAFFVPVVVDVAPHANAASAAAVLPDFTDLVERTGPAVVNIRTTQRLKQGMPGLNRGEPGDDDEQMQEFFRRFFGAPMPPQLLPRHPHGRKEQPQDQEQEQEVPHGVGSGFIISSDGYVMTNAHVVDDADEVYVTLTDKREFKAKIIGADRNSDVALVKIDGANLPRLTLGASDKIKVGEWVIAIGSPFGLENTVTAGIISAKARDIGDYLPLIQTDVAVNPGNSGGPLINMRGEVVGINSQIFSRSGGYMGISFAVPIDEALRVSDQLKAAGKVTRGRIGVQIQDVTKEVADSLNLPKAHGALVGRVEPGSPAEKGGVEAGDIIVKFNGTAIEASSDLRRLAGSTKPGTRITLTVWRKGTNRDIVVTLAEMESEKLAKKGERKQKEKAEQLSNSLGLITSDLTDEQKKDMKVDHGVVVENAEGVAQRAGIRPGDVILRLKDTDIKDVRQFNALVAKLDTKKAAVLLVLRGDSSQFVLIKPNAQ
ncbi:MAG: DegQ family serine endoprotease [Burkholderiales bacterium]